LLLNLFSSSSSPYGGASWWISGFSSSLGCSGNGEEYAYKFLCCPLKRKLIVSMLCGFLG
jgi:hypothetical protein